MVPGEEAAAAALAMDQFARNHQTIESASNLVVYEDEPSAIETPRSRSGEKAGVPRAAQETPAVAPPSESGRPVPRGMILYPRRTFYVQGVLFLVLAVITFALGYLIGRGDASYRLQVDQEKANRERMPIRGKLVYDPGTGNFAGDEGAVIIALPDRESPEPKISFEGIRPQDPVRTEPRRSVRMIRELGGEYARAKPSGEFYLVVPDKGNYRLLIISKNTTRPGGNDVDEVHLIEMEQYFSMPDHLIGRSKYDWILAEVNTGSNPIELDFGRDGQP